MRTKPYSNKEFAELARDASGNIINFADHFLLLTPRQVSWLTASDDHFYYELTEELACEMSALLDELNELRGN